MNYEYLCLFSLPVIIIILYFIEADIWIKAKGLSLGGGFLMGLSVEALVNFRLILFAIFSSTQVKFQSD